MLLGMLGTNEILIILIIIPLIIVGIVRFIYRYGKQKGRLEELEKRVNDSSSRG